MPGMQLRQLHFFCICNSIASQMIKKCEKYYTFKLVHLQNFGDVNIMFVTSSTCIYSLQEISIIC